jgi:uncharacterized protein DUF4381
MTVPLDKLHGFYEPSPPPWAPQTIGWYVLFVVAGLFLLWLAIHSIRRWLADRYRREALQELTSLSPNQFSALLKRTALTAWPREQVASLTGKPWLDFLNQTAHENLFVKAPGNSIEEIAVRPSAISSQDSQELRRLSAEWIRRHRRVQT